MLAFIIIASVASVIAVRAEDDAPAKTPVGGPEDDAAPANVEVFEQAWRIIRDQFYDRTFHGVDWDACRVRYLAKARAATTRRDLHEVTLAMLGELRTSHTALIEPDVYRDHVENETKGLLAPTYGFELSRLDQGYFVGEVVAGTPAAARGVLRGDKLVRIDGAAPEDTNLRPSPWDVGLGGARGYYPNPSKNGKPIVFEFERHKASPRPGWNRYTVELTPHSWNLLEATRTSARKVTRGPYEIGYIRIYHVLSEDIVDVVAEALSKGAVSDAAGLVLDIRGRGGLTTSVDRICTLFDTKARGGAVWSRPAVCVVDGETRSAKEILAWRWRHMNLGPIVGTKTRGAVIGSRFLPLPDGAYVVLANFDMRCLTGGFSLEGRGVSPDITVKDELPYASGRDPCLESAFDECLQRIQAAERRGKTHGWY